MLHKNGFLIQHVVVHGLLSVILSCVCVYDTQKLKLKTVVLMKLLPLNYNFTGFQAMQCKKSLKIHTCAKFEELAREATSKHNGTVPIIISASCLLDLGEGMVHIAVVSSFLQQLPCGGNDGAHSVRARGGDRLCAGGSHNTVAEIQQVPTKRLQTHKYDII